MYSVNRLTHERYGAAVQIVRDMNGLFLSPFQAVRYACREQRFWREAESKKILILIDDQVMSPQQAEHWANEEYKSLPKCYGCGNFLNENIYIHRLSSDRFYCSESCSDKGYMEKVEIMKDEEEIEFA